MGPRGLDQVHDVGVSGIAVLDDGASQAVWACVVADDEVVLSRVHRLGAFTGRAG